MANEEFAESFDDFPDDFGDEELETQPVQPQTKGKRQPIQAAPQPQPQRGRPQQPQQQQRVQASASAPVQTPEKPRFIPFVLPARSGIFDNQTGQPFMEDQDKQDLLIGLMADILNRLDKIEQGL